MRCVTFSEAEANFRSTGINVPLLDAGRRKPLTFEIASPQMRVSGRPTVDIPQLPEFISEINGWLPDHRHRLLWIANFEPFYPSVSDAFDAIRIGTGELRSLPDAPGHMFDPFPYAEQDQLKISREQGREVSLLIGLVSLVMAGGWDGWLIADHTHDRIEFWEGTSCSTPATRKRSREQTLCFRSTVVPRK
jgi:hypothetical protein